MKKNSLNCIRVLAIPMLLGILLVLLHMVKDIRKIDILNVGTEKEKSATEIFYSASNSIVEVRVSGTYGTQYGTAVFVNTGDAENVYLITNAHVVDVGDDIDNVKAAVRFADEEDYRAVKVTKFDRTSDLAILEAVDPDDMAVPQGIELCAFTEYGEKVYAVGNAMNSGLSVTEGIISNPSVNIEDGTNIRNVIQADIAIASGSSGGALMNAGGRLLGIITFRLYDDEGLPAYGFAFAVSAETIMGFIQK